MRGVISTIFCVFYVNKNLKHVIWDSVPNTHFKFLAVRCLQNSVFILIQFTIVKYLSLIYIGLAQNMTPLFTIILSYFLTGEKLKMNDVGLIFISFVGVTLITLGSPSKSMDIKGGQKTDQ
jgi:drug/metabolite transporter (DMT)-like permease